MNDSHKSTLSPEAQPSLEEAKKLVDFWKSLGPEGWFSKNDAVDRQLREQFYDLHFAAAAGRCAHWLGHPYGGLALILLLDQFPRNVFRGTGHMYATDSLARHYARQYIASGMVDEIDAPLRLFACLPFAHSEDLDDQEYSVTLYKRYAPDSKWGEHHRDIVRRYGRFPHRNAILGRATRPDEQEFLNEGGFGG